METLSTCWVWEGRGCSRRAAEGHRATGTNNVVVGPALMVLAHQMAYFVLIKCLKEADAWPTSRGDPR